MMFEFMSVRDLVVVSFWILSYVDLNFAYLVVALDLSLIHVVVIFAATHFILYWKVNFVLISKKNGFIQGIYFKGNH